MYLTDESDLEALKPIILSSKYFRYQGKDVPTQCTQFENEFAQYIGVNHSLLVTSGTNALICALSASGVGAGDEVIIPAFTFFATAVAVVNLGGIPVVANIDEYLSLDSLDVESKITDKTKAIIAVHMDGRPCKMDSLTTVAKKYGLALIEDAAQAVGGEFDGKKLGSIGDSGCFSFNVDKIISCGEGGAFLTNSRSQFEHALCVQDACCSFGATHKDSFTVVKPFIGMSMRTSEIQGVLMRKQLPRLDNIISELRTRQTIMREILPALPSHDIRGECATSIFIKLRDAGECKEKLLKLSHEKVSVVSNSMRPAHSCWQWMPLLSEKFGKERYLNGMFLKSIEILTSTLKINVPFDMNVSDVEDYSHKIRKIIEA